MLWELEATLWRCNLTMISSVTDDGGSFPDRKQEIITAIASKIIDLNEEKEMAVFLCQGQLR
jgi:hypothetical protein